MGILIEVESERAAQILQDVVSAVIRTPGYTPGQGIQSEQPRMSSSAPRALGAVQFFAKLTGHSVITTGVRWLYDFTEVAATPTFATGGVLTGVSFATFTGARTGKCVNLAEWGNNADPGGSTAWYLGDVDAHGTSYPATFALMPTGGGGTSQTHKIDRVVRLIQSVDAATGYTWWHFDRQNAHDGTCS
jgi:hypothetical protein